MQHQCPYYGRIYPTIVRNLTIWTFLVGFWSNIPRKSQLFQQRAKQVFFGNFGVFPPCFQVFCPTSGWDQHMVSFLVQKWSDFGLLLGTKLVGFWSDIVVRQNIRDNATVASISSSMMKASFIL